MSGNIPGGDFPGGSFPDTVILNAVFQWLYACDQQ